MQDQQAEKIERAALQALESLAAAGVQQLPKPSPAALRSVSRLASQSSEAVPIASESANEQKELDSPMAELNETEISAAPSLDVLRDEVAQCTLCQELASTREQTVFGVGNPQARLCFLGEAPGAEEDRQGEPFVGRAGKLLNKILEACGLQREDVYILNVLKCRPPGNRNPTPEESKNCRRFFDRQIELINPEYICCLGAVAAQNLLATTEAIGRLRGKVHQYRGVKVVCTYHPAYLLRNPSAKRHTWDDMKLLMREMGTPIE